MASVTTLQVGTYSPLTDTFSLSLDLNDRVTWFAQNASFPQPPKVFVKAANVRVVGEAIQRWQYQNRMVTLTLFVVGASTTAILASVRSFLAAVEQPPYTLRVQLAGGTTYTHWTVVKVEHVIPYKAQQLTSGVLVPIELHLECLPTGFTIPRQVLSNLVMNPGFEQPYGGGIAQSAVQVFADSFATTNAYSVQAGGAPSVAANVMTIPIGARVAFGSPAWSPLSWQVRFKYQTSQVADFFGHYVDANNSLDFTVASTALTLRHTVAGTVNTLATASYSALTNGTFYWVVFTQYPIVAGSAPWVQATLYNDASGAIGTAYTGGGTGVVRASSGTVAVSGRPQIATSGASLPIGGAFSNVHAVFHFGPGGHIGFTQLGSATGPASLAWDGTRQELGMSGTATSGTQTFPNGPVTSFGAGRIDAAPAGTLDASWALYAGGGTPASSFAMPCATAGDVLYASAQAKSSGLGNGALLRLVATEYNASGTNLRNTTLQTLTISGGVQVAWGAGGNATTLSGHWTTGANCAWVDLAVEAVDSVSGNSANATVWIDNLCCWDATTTGQTSMPYCELRMPSAPAQLLVSGLVGDTPTPVFAQVGLYLAAWNTGQTLTVYLGRKALTQVGAQLVTTPVYTGTSPVADATSWGGFYLPVTTSTGSFCYMFALTTSMAQGVFHELTRFWTNDATPANALVRARVPLWQGGWTGVQSGNQLNYYGEYYAPLLLFNPTSGAWNVADVGQVTLPVAPLVQLGDPTQVAAMVALDSYVGSGTPTIRFGASALVPTDGSLLVALVNNASNANLNVSTQWFWTYWGAGAVQPLGPISPTVGYSIESGSLPGAAHAGNTPGTSTTGNINANLSTDPLLWLDPTQSGNSAGVNQLVAWMSDNTAALLPLALELVYQPQYLYPA